MLRFIWVNDITKDQPEFQIMRFTRVVFGVSSSLFLLNAIVKHHVEKYSLSHPLLVPKLLRSTYMDDIVFGASDEENAYELYLESRKMFKDGGFNLCKFVSNSAQLQERMDNEEKGLNAEKQELGDTSDETYTKATLGSMQKVRSGEQKVLGVRWDVATDHIVFSLTDIAQQAREMEPTKRHIVSVVGRFYDPIGFLTPITIQFSVVSAVMRVEDWLERATLRRRAQEMELSLLEGQSLDATLTTFHPTRK